MSKQITRRNALRGAIGGTAVTLGLPFLDCFLNSKGTALAATGAPLPHSLGLWWQGLGLNPGSWEPSTIGRDFELRNELKILEPFKDRLNLYTGTKYFLDGRPLETHTTGYEIASTGGIPMGNSSGPSLDAKVAEVIGRNSRFRSLEISLSGSRNSYSTRGGSTKNPSEGSPVALYTRIFGPDFTDPNVAEFSPDPMVMARRSVLSYVTEQRQKIVRQLGATDRERLDRYFTSLREIEHQLELEMKKPAPLEACTVPGKPSEAQPGTIVTDADVNNRLFGGLVAHALACGQTRVFSIDAGSNGMRKQGSSLTWHMLTHEEPIDEEIGYQKESTWFMNWANAAFAGFLNELDSIPEGDGTLLDRMLVLWQTDHGDARIHSMDALPIMTIGSAGGRMKTGLHISSPGDPATRVGLTVQQAVGVPISAWGERSNQTSKTITEVLV
ncbi:MAG: hypothetical protein CMG46_04130 [Candidatus Marinimicrobia bacterium]|nr:hypothetical protein [Candidatus Neomarinimicrobiota bacterium]